MLTSFAKRHLNHRFLPHTDETRKEMLEKIGVKSQDDLFSKIPDNLKTDMSDKIPKGVDESTIIKKFKDLASKNLTSNQAAFFIGGGVYRHFVPSVVDHLIQRSEFMTPYTPYQSEISQGTLQALFEFQTLAANLADLDFANATMYDGATACMEAALVAIRSTNKKKVLIHRSLHPHWIQVIETINRHNPNMCVERLKGDKVEDWKDVACVIIQNPAVDGKVCDLSAIAEEAHKNKALMISACSEIVSLGLIKPPGKMGADIFAAEGSSLGSTMNFGGPLLGIYAAKKELMRQTPGRLVGQTKDSQGITSYCLTLAAREQHIKRGKATSNICTSSSLMGIAFSIHLALLGKEGFTKMAKWNHYNATKLAKKIGSIEGVKIETDRFFNEFTVKLPKPADLMVEALVDDKVLCGIPYTRLYQGFNDLNIDENKMLMAATELTTDEDIEKVYNSMKKYLV